MNNRIRLSKQVDRSVKSCGVVLPAEKQGWLVNELADFSYKLLCRYKKAT